MDREDQDSCDSAGVTKLDLKVGFLSKVQYDVKKTRMSMKVLDGQHKKQSTVVRVCTPIFTECQFTLRLIRGK